MKVSCQGVSAIDLLLRAQRLRLREYKLLKYGVIDFLFLVLHIVVFKILKDTAKRVNRYPVNEQLCHIANLIQEVDLTLVHTLLALSGFQAQLHKLHSFGEHLLSELV